MQYKLYLRPDESKGFSRSKKNALCILNSTLNGAKYEIHNIYVGRNKKVALCQENEIVHIIPRSAYQQFITPEIKFV